MTQRMPEYRRALVRDLRQRQTDSEELLWRQLRAGRLGGLKFRRQRPLGRYVADFCCDGLKLVVEIDGGIHTEAEQQEYDAVRDEMLSAHGYHVLRIPAEDVLCCMPQVLASIRAATQTPPKPSPPGGRGWRA